MVSRMATVGSSKEEIPKVAGGVYGFLQFGSADVIAMIASKVRSRCLWFEG